MLKRLTPIKLTIQYLITLFILNLMMIQVSYAATNAQMYFKLMQPTPTQLAEQSTATRYFSNSEITQLINELKTAQKNRTSTVLQLPTLVDETVSYRLTYDPTYQAELLQKFPEIASFRGNNVKDSKQTGRFDISYNGFNAAYMIDGQLYYLDALPDQTGYKLYQFTSEAIDDPIFHGLSAQASKLDPSLAERGALGNADSNSSLIEYRIAIAATGEYTSLYGGIEGALSGINTALNRVNQIFERELGVRFILVADNDKIIYPNRLSDPYKNDDKQDDIVTVQTNIDNIIGRLNYDIGHLFVAQGGGLAQLNSVCRNNHKAKGVSGISSLNREQSFFVNIFAHELGHQFGAGHTFNATDKACEDNRTANSAYEIGSGVTIMSYAGICGTENTVNTAIDNFHVHSLEQMSEHINDGAIGGSCGTEIPKQNSIPSVDAGANYTIPANTPFILTGTANDIDQTDTLTYSWEQFDLGTASASKSDWENNGDGPIFRNYRPSANATRYFPDLAEFILNRSNTGEVLPSNSRTLNFKLVVRDQQGGVNSDDMVITVNSNLDNFQITSHDANQTYNGGNLSTVTWHTLSTSDICSSVDILLSVDRSTDFTTLVSSVPNNGEAIVTLPNISTLSGRLMLKCHDNIFYALSSGFFDLEQNLTPSEPLITNQSAINATEELSFTLNPAQFIITDTDTDTHRITVNAGENYTVSNNIITPDVDFSGALIVNIQANNGLEISAPFTTQVNVINVNDRPVANNDSVTIDPETTIINVLTNDQDADNDPLTIQNVTYTGSGEIEIIGTTIRFTPSAAEITETFSYQISDGITTSQANVTVTVRAEPVDNGISISGGSLNLFFYLIVLTHLMARLFTTQLSKTQNG